MNPCHRWALGLGLLAACGLARADAAAQDWATLARAGQLAAWLGAPVPLPAALCVQDGLGTAWPQDWSQLPARMEDRLRRETETCLASTADGAGTRLVAEARRAFQQRLARLRGHQDAVAACQQRAPASLLDCLRTATGRPTLSAEEGGWLLDAAKAPVSGTPVNPADSSSTPRGERASDPSSAAKAPAMRAAPAAAAASSPRAR